MVEHFEIELNNLPKISLNDWYSGSHWSSRKRMKDAFILIVKSQYKNIFTRDGVYYVDYLFEFKSRPLDASNCVGMLKMIEDIIFESDGPKIVLGVSIKSRKAKADRVFIKVLKTDELLENPPF